MVTKDKVILSIKDKVKSIDPSAIIILYGSYARGENKPDSDIDLLILVNKEMSPIEKKEIRYPLYDIEFETGQIISPLVLSLDEWESKHRITPFYENIQKEGIRL